MKTKIVARGGRLYGYGVATPSRLRAAAPLEGGEDCSGWEDVERICEIGQMRKLVREEEIREAVRAEREREIREHIARQQEKKARRAAKVEQVLGWIKTGAMILALIAGAAALLWMMAGEIWAATGLLPLVAVGGRMQ